MGNTNNMISSEELEQLSKQSGLPQQILQKQFNNFKKLDRQNKGTLSQIEPGSFQAHPSIRFLKNRLRFQKRHSFETGHQGKRQGVRQQVPPAVFGPHSDGQGRPGPKFPVTSR